MRIKQIDFGKTDANNEFIDKGSEKYLDSFYDYEKYNSQHYCNHQINKKKILYLWQ